MTIWKPATTPELTRGHELKKPTPGLIDLNAIRKERNTKGNKARLREHDQSDLTWEPLLQSQEFHKFCLKIELFRKICCFHGQKMK